MVTNYDETLKNKNPTHYTFNLSFQLLVFIMISQSYIIYFLQALAKNLSVPVPLERLAGPDEGTHQGTVPLLARHVATIFSYGHWVSGTGLANTFP